MNVDIFTHLLSGYRITITGQTGAGRRRNLATVVGVPGAWIPHDDHLAGRMTDELLKMNGRRMTLLMAEMMSAWLRDLESWNGGASSLREEIPWPVVSIVCDVVHEAGRKSVSLDSLKDVGAKYGSRISHLNELPPDRRQHAVAALHKAIASIVVLPFTRQ
ncbi:hypothetical protein GAN17_09495 [Mycobacterium kubicae]|uniref:hypothetical protein n=1 Tax=Mycobacterium kubicae TaxID=120959 RepID=UPI001640B73D|nr:hypothetical protein [Mycobacterium kubicae]QNI06506.1 hypothetical protein GAN17_09495 [Mycobacterium kubicae]